MCPHFDKKNIQLSLDGVSESKSTNVTMDVFSIKFEGCGVVYPLRIVRPLKKNAVNVNEQLRLVLYDINDNDLKISQFIADNPKRSSVKQCLCFSSWYPCEYCFSKGSKVVTNNPDFAKKKKALELQIKIIEEKIQDLKQQPSTSAPQKELVALQNILKELKNTANFFCFILTLPTK